MRVLLVVVAGCWTGPSAAPTSTAPPFVCPQARGTPSDYAHPVIAGITTALEMCGDMSTNEGRIRVSRASGARTLGADGCVALPADSTACPVIHPGLLLASASQELAAAGVSVIGTGLSTCTTWVRGEYEPSISTDRWTDAAEVVRRVAEILDRYDIAGSTNVAVRHIPCTVSLGVR